MSQIIGSQKLLTLLHNRTTETVKGLSLEKEILNLIVGRNRILGEIIRLSHLAILEFAALDQDDINHFFLTRKYFIEALVHCEDRIIARSMMDWSKFSFDTDYRAEYIKLSNEKEEKVVTIISQDKVLESLMSKEIIEKIA